MLKLIQDNPSRYLGVCSNSPARERIANVGKLKAYLKVGKNVKFPSDLEGMLPAVNRSLEGTDSAISKINLPNDQLKYALFWFINVAPIDKMALDYLWMGNVEKSCEILGKKETYSSLINRGVLGFLQNDYASAVRNITLVIHNENHRTQFVEAVCGNTFQISEEELSEMFINALLEEIDAVKLSPIFEQNSCSQKDCELIKEKSTAGLIASINMAIESAKSIDRNDASSQLQAGKKLMTSTKSDLNTLCGVLGNTDMQYQMIADRLANQILQCGINYYNNTDEDDEVSIDKALNVQKYAFKIAVGKLAKDRCRENCKILEDKKKTLPPKEVKEFQHQINSQILSFKLKQNVTFKDVLILLHSTAKPLVAIKEKLLGTDKFDFYSEMSTLVAQISLSVSIDLLNEAQNNEFPKLSDTIKREQAITILKSAFKDSWEIMNWIDHMNVSLEFRQNRIKPNKSVLIKILKDVDAFESPLASICLSAKAFARGLFSNRTSIFSGCAYDVHFDERTYMTEQEIFQSCKTIKDFQYYLNKYPLGKYADIAKVEIARIEKEELAERKRREEELKAQMVAKQKEMEEKLSQTNVLSAVVDLFKHYNGNVNDISPVCKKMVELCLSEEDCKSVIEVLRNNDKYKNQAQNKLEEIQRRDRIKLILILVIVGVIILVVASLIFSPEAVLWFVIIALIACFFAKLKYS